MSHCITALIVRDKPFDVLAARDWDVVRVPLGAGLCLVHIDHYYTAYWQKRRGEVAKLDVPPDFSGLFPREGVVLSLAAALTGAVDRGEAPTFALVMTDYFGGVGDQWASAYVNGRRIPDVRHVNDALRALGVQAIGEADEFDTVGLGKHRSSPDYLERYVALCDELGV